MKNFIFLFLILPTIVLAQPALQQADTLTLEQCVQIAMKHNPSIRVAEGGLESSESDLKLSRSVLMPQISAQAALTRNGGTSVTGLLFAKWRLRQLYRGFSSAAIDLRFREDDYESLRLGGHSRCFGPGV